jgi:NAD(P)H-hydrate repair Nnr-like enzyme with NAD(P)H-hydrate dehydratase domain
MTALTRDLLALSKLIPPPLDSGKYKGQAGKIGVVGGCAVSAFPLTLTPTLGLRVCAHAYAHVASIPPRRSTTHCFSPPGHTLVLRW